MLEQAAPTPGGLPSSFCMKILHVVDTLGVGGAERVVVHLAEAFRNRGHQVAVGCVYKDGPMAKPLLRAGIPVHVLHKPPGFHWSTVRRLTALAREFGAEAIHTHNPQVHHYGVLAACMAHVRGVVNTLHGVNNLANAGLPARMIYGATGPWTDCIAVVSEDSRRFFEKIPFLAKHKMKVIYNGIPLDPFLAVDPPSDSGGVVFGVVGRQVPIKDHRTALRAFAEIVREYPDCRLELAGDGPLHQELQSEARSLGVSDSVIFRGELENIPEFFGKVDVFLMSSLSEGLPMSLLEAMGAGRPVISTAVGGIPEIVEAAHCGWLCPAGDSPAMANAMRQAIQATDRVAIGAQARAFAVKYCSLERMAEQYENVFTELL